jgi:hypothetical protein
MKENETEVYFEEEKDEYWGHWEKCLSCKSVGQPAGGNYCMYCGKKIIKKL